jgi:hypothetical protein
MKTTAAKKSLLLRDLVLVVAATGLAGLAGCGDPYYDGYYYYDWYYYKPADVAPDAWDAPADPLAAP